MIGRRIYEGELEQPGDYCFAEVGGAGEGLVPTIFFIPPNRAPDRFGLASVCSPPHTFRHCDDGSIEVRASIGIYDDSGTKFSWHGYLDEGHVWREC